MRGAAKTPGRSHAQSRRSRGMYPVPMGTETVGDS